MKGTEKLTLLIVIIETMLESIKETVSAAVQLYFATHHSGAIITQ